MTPPHGKDNPKPHKAKEPTVGRQLFRKPPSKIQSTLKGVAGRATAKAALAKAKENKNAEGQEVQDRGSISRPPRKKVCIGPELYPPVGTKKKGRVRYFRARQEEFLESTSTSLRTRRTQVRLMMASSCFFEKS